MAPIWCRRYCQRVPQSEELSGSVTIKRTSRKCNNQKHFQEVSQSKVLPGSAAIMGTARQYHKKCIQGVLQFKELQGRFPNQKYCQGVSQFKYLRKCHNLKYYQGPPQSEVLPWTATIKIVRECCNKTYPGSATNRKTTREYDH